MVAKFQRARTSETKESRRLVIVEAAKAIIDKDGFTALTMDQVAKRCKLAKGTLYIYFSSREDLLLAVLMEDFSEWFLGMHEHLGTCHRPFDESFLIAWLSGVEREPRLAMGMSYLHLMLEPNVSEDFALGWKSFLLAKLKDLHYELLLRFEPSITLELLTEFFTLLTSLSVGLWMQTFTPPQIKKALQKNPEFKLFEVNLPDLFMKAGSAILDSPSFVDLQKLGPKG